MGISISKTRQDGRSAARDRRHLRVRKRVQGSAERPRLVVSRSLRHMVAQVVDDSTGRTLAAASSMEAAVRGGAGDKTAQAAEVGRLVARRARDAGVSAVVFDRSGNQYHGRVAAVADGAREEGLAL